MSTKPQDPRSPSPAVAASGPAVKVGSLAPGCKANALLVDFDGNPAGPLPARSVVGLDEAAIRNALLSRQPVVLAFENEDRRLPIIVGLLPSDPGAALLGSLLHSPNSAAPPARRTGHFGAGNS